MFEKPQAEQADHFDLWRMPAAGVRDLEHFQEFAESGLRKLPNSSDSSAVSRKPVVTQYSSTTWQYPPKAVN